jgi:hypothetical protein
MSRIARLAFAAALLAGAAARAGERPLALATTTSVRDSGLMDELQKGALADPPAFLEDLFSIAGPSGDPVGIAQAAGRESLVGDLERVIRDTRVAVALVSHELRHALPLADRIAVSRRGLGATLKSGDPVWAVARPEDAHVLAQA